MKKILIIAGKVCVSALIGLVFLEACIRTGLAFFPSIMPPIYFGGAHPRGMIIPDKELGYTLMPGFQGEETNDFREYHISVKINTLGLRDGERDLGSKNYRIIGLGDSYTFGEGVELDQTYLSRLEERLREKKIEIIKAGVPGYNTEQEILLLKRMLPVYKPQAVILGLLPQEFTRLESPYTYCHGYIVEAEKLGQLYPAGNRLYSSRAKNPVVARLDVYIKHYYYTPQFMQSRFKNLRSRFKKTSPVNQAQRAPREKFARTLELLRQYRDICVSSRAQPVLLLLPGDKADNDYLRESSENLGIRTLDLFPVFEPLKQKNLPFHYPHDLHWNAAGHEAAASALYDFLKDSL